MAAGSTYTPIATYTASGSQSSITFSSIPSTYTDLVLVINGTIPSASNIWMRYNGDTGSNYSETLLYGSGSAATSARDTSVTSHQGFGYYDTNVTQNIIQIQNYSNTTTYKTTLSRFANAGVATSAWVGLWRSTSAINTVLVYSSNGNNFSSSTTMTLYGIQAA